MNSQEFYKKYLEDFVWVGDLYIDDGWGPKQRVISDLCKFSFAVLDKVVEESIEDPLFLCSPTSDQVTLHIPTCQVPGFRSINQRYSVALLNQTFETFDPILEIISSLTLDKFQLVLKAYTVVNGVLKGGNILLAITKKDALSEPTFKLVEGRSVIVYDRPRVLAEWVQDNSNKGT